MNIAVILENMQPLLHFFLSEKTNNNEIFPKLSAYWCKHLFSKQNVVMI